MKEIILELIMMLMKRMNKMLLVAALAATTLSAQAEQKKGLRTSCKNAATPGSTSAGVICETKRR